MAHNDDGPGTPLNAKKITWPSVTTSSVDAVPSATWNAQGRQCMRIGTRRICGISASPSSDHNPKCAALKTTSGRNGAVRMFIQQKYSATRVHAPK